MKTALRLMMVVICLAGMAAAGWRGPASASAQAPGKSGGLENAVFLPQIGKPYAGPLGSVSGRVINATTGEGIVQVSVCRIDTHQCAFTQAGGHYHLEGLPAGSTLLVVNPDGYYYREQPADILGGVAQRMDFAMVPFLQGDDQRYVLTWNVEGDLDANLWLADGSHIWWRNTGLDDHQQCVSQACLEYDDRLTGPESIFSLERTSGKYTFAVFRNGDAEITQYGANLTVYDSQGAVASFNCPNEGVGSWWWVFELDGDTGEFTELNVISSVPPR